MSAFVGSNNDVAKTGSVYIDGLLWGSRWLIEDDNRTITYSFLNNTNWDDAWTQAGKNAVQNALQSWANVANFKLEFSANDTDAELLFHLVNNNVLDGNLGQANPPGEDDDTYVEGTVLINWEAYSTNVGVGSYDYITFVHEIGHALGLAHPHDDGGTSSIYPGVSDQWDTGNFGLNQFVWTVMSYIDIDSSYSPGDAEDWGFIGGPMAFDIAAIQHIYGINTTYNTGNNTYNLPTVNGPGTYWSCIWDAGGIDTISGKDATTKVTIDLRNASLANGDPNAGGYINRVDGISGGFTIANSKGGLCVVENAIGGNFNDSLTGNDYNNSLIAGSGDDTVSGGGGKDTLVGGSGRDILNGNTGKDILTGGTGNDTFVFRYGQSTVGNFDTITDFAIKMDKVDLLTQGGAATPSPTKFTRAKNNTATTLTNAVNSVFADADGLTGGNQALGINSAALMVVGTAGIAGTYLIMNDAVAGFQSTLDSVVNITGYTGTLPSLGTIAVKDFFV